jgi:hypothetical protein
MLHHLDMIPKSMFACRCRTLHRCPTAVLQRRNDVVRKARRGGHDTRIRHVIGVDSDRRALSIPAVHARQQQSSVSIQAQNVKCTTLQVCPPPCSRISSNDALTKSFLVASNKPTFIKKRLQTTPRFDVKEQEVIAFHKDNDALTINLSAFEPKSDEIE